LVRRVGTPTCWPTEHGNPTFARRQPVGGDVSTVNPGDGESSVIEPVK
jgi:hypothetical protein